MSDTDTAYLAGLIDGEGCITITRQRPGKQGRINWSYRIFITMGHRQTIERVREITGVGSIQEQRHARYNTAWSWIASAHDARIVLERVRPYLIAKAVEADLALEWFRLPLAPRGGKSGGQQVPPELLQERHRLFLALQEAKPSSRFRRGAADATDRVHQSQVHAGAPGQD